MIALAIQTRPAETRMGSQSSDRNSIEAPPVRSKDERICDFAVFAVVSSIKCMTLVTKQIETRST